MSFFFNIVCLALPFIVSAVVTPIDSITLNNATFIHQSYYMYSKKEAPSSSYPGNGRSFINLSIDIRKKNVNENAFGTIEALIVPESFYNEIGYYDEHGKRTVCCDGKAIKDRQCSTPYQLMLPSQMPSYIPYSKIDFTGEHQSTVLNYDIYTSGKYYIVIGACSPDTSNIVIQGESLSMNPFGHLSGRLYGLSLFSKLLVLVYFVLCAFWFYRIFHYYQDLLSIHVFISMVLFIFTCSTAMTSYKLSSLNLEGVASPILTSCANIMNSLARTLIRCLLLLISKGLGISVPSLGSSFWLVLLLCICYFFNAVGYEYSLEQPSIVFTEIPSTNLFTYTSVLIDALFYCWIIRNLFTTIDDLQKKKQTSKLQIFLTLRNLLLFLVFMVTVYNVVFSYLVSEQIVQNLWKWQWFFTEGVWSSLYLVVIISILYLWAPDDRSVAYAFHQQIATDEKTDTEEYAMPEVELQTSGGKVEVTSVNDTVLKPMKM